jgi:valyl-tRNA synthetase
LSAYSQTIGTLAQVSPLKIVDSRHMGGSSDRDLVLVLKNTEVLIPLASMIDPEAEKNRLQKEYAEVKANVDRLEIRLNDTAFTGKAPAAVVEKERVRLVEGKDKLNRLDQQLARFK